MILARSTYNLNFPVDGEEVLNLALWFKQGNLGDALGTPNYELEKRVPALGVTDLDIQIDAFARDFLQPRPVWHNGSSGIFNSNPNSQCYTTASYFFDSESPAFKVNQLVTTKGWYNYTEGLNFAGGGKRILTTSEYWQVKRGEWLLIPFLTNEDGSIILAYGSSTVTLPFTLNAGINTRIRYVLFNTAIVQDKYITVRYESSTADILGATIELVDECKYDHQHFIFLNRFGAWQQLYTFKQSTKSINVKSDEFVNAFISGGQYDAQKHQYKEFNKQGRESVEVSTGFVKEEMNSIIEEMLMSEDVYLERNGTFIPINVKTRSILYQTRKVDRLINYTLEYEFAFDKLVSL